ncbi:DNA replication and repair protein RecR [Flexibacter flexilis DSM 6793]|uniref:Recombination protein RecR n=1 Tax=Flexibacter flexilis DSM 6793 TaxID=927664 RepID=A0A1I1DH66_9BACT|nr:recombination mediator RecR [Flexibacter flexilis]SFB71883.1 DNA replication and repair protein RecR [Flexibacter flexilis DSM 6793]
MNSYPSKLIENAVNEIAKLPGIGRKTALRLALHLLKSKEENTFSLTNALTDLRTQTRYCKQCHNISDEEICGICQSARRDRTLLCVVENIPDVMAIENTGQYFGQYHVLGGIISPMAGISPSDLHIDSLIERVQHNEIKEVILALSSTMEADTTSFYIQKKLKPLNVKISVIARGIPVGGELEYADEITLGRSIQGRISAE